MNSLFEPVCKWGCLLLLMAISAGYGIRLGRNSTTVPTPTRTNSMGPTVIQLEKLGELTATRIHITDVLWAESASHRGSWLICGDALLSCDVTKANILNVDEFKHTATIRLPPLRVVSARVDHEKTKTWNVEKTSWLRWHWSDDAMRDVAMFHAQKLVESAAGSERNLEPARAHAEMLIQRMYKFVDWSVAIEWQ